MSRSWRPHGGAWLLFPALLLSLPSALGAEPKPLPARSEKPLRLPFAAGESLEYQGRWQSLDAASAHIAVAAGSSPGTLRLVTDARTSPLVSTFLDARFESEIECDAKTLLPLRVRRVSDERGKKHVEEAVFDRAHGQVVVAGQRLPLDASAQDPVSVLYAICAMRFGRLGSVQRLALSDLGQPLDLDIEVADRKDGLVSLKLTSTERAVPHRRSEFRVAMEESGRRRIVSLVTVLPFGEITLELKR